MTAPRSCRPIGTHFPSESAFRFVPSEDKDFGSGKSVTHELEDTSTTVALEVLVL